MTQTIDLVVALGKYTDKEGKEKTRYENIGKIVQKDDGGEFILLKRTFNPAGVPNPDNKDMVIVSMFSNEGRGGGGSQREERAPNSRPQQSRPAGQSNQGGGFNDFEDDIPF
jgi:hypothetical protein